MTSGDDVIYLGGESAALLVVPSAPQSRHSTITCQESHVNSRESRPDSESGESEKVADEVVIKLERNITTREGARYDVIEADITIGHDQLRPS